MVKLLESIDLGSAVAEHDTLLYEARVETRAFTDLFRDRVDIVPGTKGSGKTSLYRLLSEYIQPILLKSNIIVLTGVEASGDPVFQAFRKSFESLNEAEFENFWRIYFVALILNRCLKNSAYETTLERASKEVAEVKTKCRAANIPEINHAKPFREIVESVLRCLKVKIGTASNEPTGETSYSLLEVEPNEPGNGGRKRDAENEPVFLSDIHDAIVGVLQRAGVKIWILLDRLDEVFPRRTKLERVALRALFRTTRNFPTALIRIKLFIRDDIFETILMKGEGFTALSHIEARRSATLRWSASEIQLLIVRRLSANPRIRSHFTINKQWIEENHPGYAQKVFSRFFPPQVIPGKSQSDTIDWLYHHCEDGRGAVTPRDVLDLLEYAIEAQINLLKTPPNDTSYLIGAQALKDALVELSRKKRRAYLEAEFPEFWGDIKKFEHSKAEHNEDSLCKVLGSKWAEKVEDLVAIGFLQRRRAKMYIIPFMFRAGMEIRQGKAFAKNGD